MTAQSSTLYTNQNNGLTSGDLPAGNAHTVRALVASVAVPNTLALNDTLNFFYVPKGLKIVAAELVSDDLDSGGPTITLDIGDADGAQTIFAASAIGGTGGVDANMVRGAIGKQYTTRTLIFGTVHAAATTKVAGNVYLRLFYTMEGSPTS